MYAALFFVQLGSPVKASWWNKPIYDYKEYLALNIIEEKLIVVGGSNALFGIHSNVLQEELNIPVVNLGQHASLDLDFYRIQLLEHVKKGDVVVMPLEFSYFYNESLSEGFVNDMLAWGWDIYIKKLGFFDFISFFYYVSTERVVSGLKKNYEPDALDAIDVVRAVADNMYNEGNKWKGYNFRSINQYGEMSIDGSADEHLQKKYKAGISYLKADAMISDSFIRKIRRIKENVESKGAVLIITWPPTLKNSLFDLSDIEQQKRILIFLNHLKKHDLFLACDISDFHFSIDYFFNTKYHLNFNGGLKRSKNLVNCLRNLI
jgi:hypothetical protein